MTSTGRSILCIAIAAAFIVFTEAEAAHPGSIKLETEWTEVRDLLYEAQVTLCKLQRRLSVVISDGVNVLPLASESESDLLMTRGNGHLTALEPLEASKRARRCSFWKILC
ncbi:hypothetical protein HOLleu_38613 [Holothuria leucospilota]|uniref:Uncharacterized protein n=1 Tax=Holothuria leucospilota TaxID=206669 RepID=A0A9Q1BDH7_HOLLE|nr:hypothetical protein HOLleu_38613 [Holothuria leucospilota]